MDINDFISRGKLLNEKQQRENQEQIALENKEKQLAWSNIIKAVKNALQIDEDIELSYFDDHCPNLEDSVYLDQNDLARVHILFNRSGDFKIIGFSVREPVVNYYAGIATVEYDRYKRFTEATIDEFALAIFYAKEMAKKFDKMTESLRKNNQKALEKQIKNRETSTEEHLLIALRNFISELQDH